MTGTETMICFSGWRSTLYRPGSRSRSWAARSNRDIIASNGFSSFRKRSLSGMTILSVGSRRSVAMRGRTWAGGTGSWGSGNPCREDDLERGVEHRTSALDHGTLRNIPQGRSRARPEGRQLDRVLEGTDDASKVVRGTDDSFDVKCVERVMIAEGKRSYRRALLRELREE